jgi:hypothetical protein
MYCIKYKKNVLAKDCDFCYENKKCDPICVKRFYMLGVRDNDEPSWLFTHQEALKYDHDISYFFDLKWKGNPHLVEKLIEKKKKNGYKKKPIPNSIKWEVWERDNFTCKICGNRKYLSVDHIYPECKGGVMSFSNLQTLCRSCNSRKGSKIIKEIESGLKNSAKK